MKVTTRVFFHDNCGDPPGEAMGELDIEVLPTDGVLEIDGLRIATTYVSSETINLRASSRAQLQHFVDRRNFTMVDKAKGAA